MKVFIAASVIAVVLALILLWTPAASRKELYKLGFLVGLSAFLVVIAGQPADATMYLGDMRGRYLVAVLLALITTSPEILLIETGLLGYRGFSSWMRHFSLSLVVVGTLWLLVALVVPRLLRS
jgi:hypothetical protein